jgi:hypothetical protein
VVVLLGFLICGYEAPEQEAKRPPRKHAKPPPHRLRRNRQQDRPLTDCSSLFWQQELHFIEPKARVSSAKPPMNQPGVSTIRTMIGAQEWELTARENPSKQNNATLTRTNWRTRIRARLSHLSIPATVNNTRRPTAMERKIRERCACLFKNEKTARPCPETCEWGACVRRAGQVQI